MIHRGEIVERAIRQSGVSITAVAERLGKSRRWMYLMFENPAVPIEIVNQIGAIIHYNFKEEILGTSSNAHTLISETNLATENVNYWKEKYLNLLEEYNTLLKRFHSTSNR